MIIETELLHQKFEDGYMVKKIALAIVLSGIATMASAGQGETCKVEYLFGFIPVYECTPNKGTKPVTAPEIDPASAMGGLTLLLGGLVVLRGRRSKTSEV
jgi:hypothetical protein